MKLFSPMYDWVMVKVRHPHAPAYLYGMSFAESVFFPVPVDVMLAPMTLAKPEKAWTYAGWSTIFSVLGGIVGYWLGYFLFDALVEPAINAAGYQDKFAHAISWFEQWGIWVVFLAGFSPIPYKVFTVSAGMLQMAFLPFAIASLFGRGMRFFLVAWLMRWGGAKMEAKLRDNIDMLGWLTIALAVIGYLLLR